MARNVATESGAHGASRDERSNGGFVKTTKGITMAEVDQLMAVWSEQLMKAFETWANAGLCTRYLWYKDSGVGFPGQVAFQEDAPAEGWKLCRPGVTPAHNSSQARRLFRDALNTLPLLPI